MNVDDKEKLLLATPLKGSNQIAVRSYNERLVLHLLRQYGTMTKAEATRATGLSANAVSVIFNALEADNLLLRDAPRRGRVGQPSVPMRLNPDANRYLGLKIGRRSFDLVAVDFCGGVLARRIQRHDYPTPARAIDFLNANLRPLLRSAKLRRDEVSGFGVAMPSELWHWTEDFGAPREEMDAWREFDPVTGFADLVPGPISVENDGAAACRAELVFGPPTHKEDVIYFFLGAFIGGGIVLNGSVFTGRRGTAGGFGPLRIPDEPGGDRLIDHASLVVLEHLLADAGADPETLYSDESGWRSHPQLITAWMTRAARSLAHAIVSTQAVIEFEAVVIDGAIPADMRARLIEEVRAHLYRLDLRGIQPPEISAGRFGSIARALGAAAFHISVDYMVDQNTVLRK
ncbi:ROK family transcriptional regulator [Acidimangrovimonas sediminis]|uniref:ROK family transcriptional regulator n=1 Tax=Acidimangrovimonas sediminis TaxID=2056283 RepID=UPI001304BA27|nr:ROK family transcriptional regulator [Acidimangrovimonas sediminis]